VTRQHEAPPSRSGRAAASRARRWGRRGVGKLPRTIHSVTAGAAEMARASGPATIARNASREATIYTVEERRLPGKPFAPRISVKVPPGDGLCALRKAGRWRGGRGSWRLCRLGRIHEGTGRNTKKEWQAQLPRREYWSPPSAPPRSRAQRGNED